MQIKIKKHSTGLLVALFTFTTGVAVTMLWVVPHFRTGKTQSALRVSDALKHDEISLPDGWKNLEIKNKVFLRLPQDMEPTELPGDSFRYREAYSNRHIHITIVGDVLVPESDDKLRKRRVYSCDTPDYLLVRPTYHESVIEIDGRKAKLGIDRNQVPEGIIARLCFPTADDNAFELLVAANCKDDRALETAQQIFASIRFKDNR